MANVRTDSWAAALSEDQSWELYYKSRRCHWQEAAFWAIKEFGLAEIPSRSSFYAWQKKMRESESGHRLELQRVACLEAAAIAKESPLADEVTVTAYKQMAVENALRTGSAKEAQKFVEMAAAITDRALKRQELKLKEKAQETKDEQLRLAREKFEAAEKRLNAAAEVVSAPELTNEERISKMKEIFGIK